MNTLEQQHALQARLADLVPGVRLPAALVQRLAEALATESFLLACGDVRSLGFGSYEGQLCLVTPTRVLLATGTRVAAPERAFGLEQWDREVAPLPHLRTLRPRSPLPDER